MALLRFDQLSFAYPLAETRALDGITLTFLEQNNNIMK